MSAFRGFYGGNNNMAPRNGRGNMFWPQGRNTPVRQGFAQRQPQRRDVKQANQGDKPYSDPSVTFEPLDEKTYAEIAKSLAARQGTLQGQVNDAGIVQQPAPDAPIPQFTPPPVEAKSQSDQRAERLAAVIQNERNSERFYSGLAEFLGHGEGSGFAGELKRISSENIKKLREICSRSGLAEQKPEEQEIIEPLALRRALQLAAEEESFALHALLDLYESEADEKNTRIMCALIMKKLGIISRMQLYFTENRI